MKTRSLASISGRIAFLLLTALGCMIGVTSGIAQNPLSSPGGTSAYEILSSDAKGFTIAIHPNYERTTVYSADSTQKFVKVHVSTGSSAGIEIGAPALERLLFPILTPTQTASTFSIISEKKHIENGVDLAPVSFKSWVQGIPTERYQRNDHLYRQAKNFEKTHITANGMFRTAFTNELAVSPIQYDAASKTLTLTDEIVIRVNYSGIAATQSAPRSSSEEATFFQSLFVNGDRSDLYRSAVTRISAQVNSDRSAYKNSSLGSSDEKWMSVKTLEEGIYRISASDIKKLGVSTIDASTLSLYGFGGYALPEGPDSLSGELAEIPLDIRKDGDGNFIEARFFAPGITEWKLGSRNDFSLSTLGRLYHIMNPYSSQGNFLLKVGGIGQGKRIVSSADVITGSPKQTSSVFTVALYENEQHFEVPSISREFVGEQISLGRDLSITLPNLPGYMVDTATVRPGVDSRVYSPSTVSYNVKINSTDVGSVIGGTLDPRDVGTGATYATRNWGTEFRIPNSMGKPTGVTFTLVSGDKQPKGWLDFVETFYQRKTSLSEGAVPFMIFADTNTYSYSFTEAANAEVWDVSDPHGTRRVGSTSGSNLNFSLQAKGETLRHFIAFVESNIHTADISSTSLSLRNGICQSGATDFIITPEAFLPQAKKLAAIRTRGGQATEPMSVAVISLEDIYREFGYGSHDVSAIRDFLSFSLRHSAIGGGTTPVFATLFGGGHADYQNRMTQLPVLFPMFETYEFGSVTTLRSTIVELVPDDAFFGRFGKNSDRIDMAVGRIPVLTSDEAESFVRKVEKYETSSDEGLWRGTGTFFIDDRYYESLDDPDPIAHINDSESELARVGKNNDRLLINKLYSPVYPTTTIAGGQRRKPELEKAIVDAFNNGSVIFSYVGHGSATVWTNESVLSVPSTINKLTNFNRLAFLTTATCDFSAFDDYTKPASGGMMFITKSDGGAIASLATSRSVYPGEELVYTFFETLFKVGCDEGQGSNHIGLAYVAGRNKSSNYSNKNKFIILGDPSQRLLLPRQFVVIDSIDGVPFNRRDSTRTIPSLSQVKIAGHISRSCTGLDVDASFTGKATLSLFDAPTNIVQVSTFPTHSAETDRWSIEGPILYRGSATVTGGRFTTTFIVPKDIKFDSNHAKLHTIAYSDDFRSAMGVEKNIRIYGTDASRPGDVDGPELSVFIGSRRFHSGDVVPAHSKIIVDVKDISGLNTSTASIGHSFIGWTNDSTSEVIDFANSYVANQDDYTSGTAEQQAQLPLGKNVLHVRAFDSQNNPTKTSVEFIARSENPYDVYDVNVSPHPIRTGTVFSFMQPSAPESPVDVSLAIFNIEGRKVREIEQNSISQNEVRIPWDICDDNGTPVPDAAYAYRLTVRERLSGKEVMRGGVVIVVKQ